jgi:hypothetical protein
VTKSVKRERQRLLLAEAGKPRNRKQLTLTTYSENYEFRTFQVTRMHEN